MIWSYIPSDGQTYPMVSLKLPWRKHRYRAWLVVILSGWPWRWTARVV